MHRSVIQCSYNVAPNSENNVLKKLTKHGNSWALVIDKPIMDLLNINEETLLEVSTEDGKGLKISPVQSEERAKKFKNSLSKINKKYGKALKNLA
jgi:antitoxin MazE